MLDNNLIQSTSSWPFVEIRKLLKDRKDIIKKKNKITFQTGYGPSGLPHIGTFGEVARTTMMINALNHIEKINHELITFSDDMDGLRKVPDNIPNDQVLKDNLGKPLTNIPDPFKKFDSFGKHNNEMLKEFLNRFEKIDFHKYYLDTPFKESCMALYNWAPIADELKILDKEIVLNSMRLKWNLKIDEFKKLTKNLNFN